jgi:hypothetical protein
MEASVSSHITSEKEELCMEEQPELAWSSQGLQLLFQFIKNPYVPHDDGIC